MKITFEPNTDKNFTMFTDEEIGTDELNQVLMNLASFLVNNKVANLQPTKPQRERSDLRSTKGE